MSLLPVPLDQGYRPKFEVWCEFLTWTWSYLTDGERWLQRTRRYSGKMISPTTLVNRLSGRFWSVVNKILRTPSITWLPPFQLSPASLLLPTFNPQGEERSNSVFATMSSLKRFAGFTTSDDLSFLMLGLSWKNVIRAYKVNCALF